ncbi:MAG: hypothetical protein ACOYBQ_08405 [Fluviibacter sp.]
MHALIWILWPSFIAAAIAEFGFFAFADPQQLYWLGTPVSFSTTATYTIGFLAFWVICAGSSVLTYFLLPPRMRETLAQRPELPEASDTL